MSAPILLPLDHVHLDEEIAGGARLQRTVLPSGVRLITEDVPGAASVSIGCYVPLGSRDEREREYGASHFLEHLLFKGTPSRDAREIALEFERVGGDFNAATSREQTVYHARVRAEDLGMAIDVLADMLTGSLLDRDEFELERGVILEEIAMSEDEVGLLKRSFEGLERVAAACRRACSTRCANAAASCTRSTRSPRATPTRA